MAEIVILIHLALLKVAAVIIAVELLVLLADRTQGTVVASAVALRATVSEAAVLVGTQEAAVTARLIMGMEALAPAAAAAGVVKV